MCLLARRSRNARAPRHRLAGSSDFFRRAAARQERASIVAAHDGFALRDLVSYTAKHNQANGEDNRDGRDENFSWNSGLEGETAEPAIEAMRRRDMRGLITTLLVARGTPMLTAGDEIGRTQRGNNNAYAQDNEITCRLAQPRQRARRLRRPPGAGCGATSRRCPPTTSWTAPPRRFRIPDVAWLHRKAARWKRRTGRRRAHSQRRLLSAGDRRGRFRSRVVASGSTAAAAAATGWVPDARDGWHWLRVLGRRVGRRGAQPKPNAPISLAPRSVAILAEMQGREGLNHPASTGKLAVGDGA
jgi:glycogen operon protein